MKAALVDSHRERIAPHRGGRAGRRRHQPLHRDRALAADRRRRGRHPRRRPGGRGRADRRARARGARERDQAAVDAALAELRAWPRDERREHHAGDDRRRPRRRDDRRVGAGAARRVRLLPRADRRRRGRGRAGRRRGARRSCATRSTACREALGRRLKILVGKPGLDGHSNGAEQIAVRARDAGMDVVYEGIRLTPSQIAASRAAGGRPRDRALDPLGLAPRADPGRDRRAARGAASTRRSSSAGSSPRPTSRRCARPASPRSTRRRTSTSPDHARHRRARGGAQRRRRRRARRRERPRREPRTAPSSARGCASGDLSAAPAVLNLVETATPAAASEAAALLREVSPAALGGEAPAHVVGVTGPPGAGKSTLLSARSSRAWRRRRAHRRGARRRPVLAALGRRRCSATARGSTPTRPTAACSSARRPPASGSAASRPPRARPRRRWPRRSTSS